MRILIREATVPVRCCLAGQLVIGPPIVRASFQDITAFGRTYFGYSSEQIARRGETRRLRRLSIRATGIIHTCTIPKTVTAQLRTDVQNSVA